VAKVLGRATGKSTGGWSPGEPEQSQDYNNLLTQFDNYSTADFKGGISRLKFCSSKQQKVEHKRWKIPLFKAMNEHPTHLFASVTHGSVPPNSYGSR